MSKTKKYSIEVSSGKKGTQIMTRTNHGFNAFELLGILEIVRADVLKHLSKAMEDKIDVIEKRVIKDVVKK